MATKALLNISGHPLSNIAIDVFRQKFDIIEDVKFNLIDFNDDIIFQIEAIVNLIKIPLDGTVGITIIPPSQSFFAVLLTIYIEGLLGNYPSICLLEPNEDGVYVPNFNALINGHNVRKQGREKRLFKWAK
ncbi:hypothetical protein IC229_22420 [Spirosoma sp. BT702]|uniref:Uncharacterized protein n=1 Tax=Spirosoma profusum TaxID=2771354 RepID=A0A926Y4Q2_9BACT|nr:CRISPR-associated protein Csx15 [Spirosoma profusum]MBD2703416.1 hypothetical protein [Spirosoma profusum]